MLEVGLGALVRGVGRAAVLHDALEVDLLEDLEAARRRLRAAELVVARHREGGRSREKGQQYRSAEQTPQRCRRREGGRSREQK
jgi:hypothetical protein